MPAWQVTNQWDNSYISRFQQGVIAGVERYSARSVRFTCEDLPLQLIIDFAQREGLPLRVKNESRARGYVPQDFETLEEYRIGVLRSTGARDLLIAGNTVAVGADAAGRDRNLDFAQPGDVIVLDYGEHGHVQVVTRVAADRIDIAQGNFPDPVVYICAEAEDPRADCYLGVPIQRYHYALRDGRWRYVKPGGDELVIEHRHGKVRRWNFTGWNGQPAQMRMGGPEALARPGRRW